MNNTNLIWGVNEFNFDSKPTRAALHSRGIFQRMSTSSDGVTTSVVTVFGNIKVNSNIRVCCRSLVGLELLREACTVLIIYGIYGTMSCYSLNNIVVNCQT